MADPAQHPARWQARCTVFSVTLLWLLVVCRSAGGGGPVGKPPYSVGMLCEAAWDGDLPLIKKLVASGVPVNGQDKDGHTPLGRAVQSENTEIVRFLLREGAKPETDPDEPGWLVEYALVGRTEEIALLLIAHGAEIKGTTEYGTLLHDAAALGKPRVARKLIEKGLDVSAKNADGLLPLHCAIDRAEVATAKLLLKMGADRTINLPTPSGKTALHMAWRRSRKLLLAHGATTGFPVLDAIVSENFARVKAMLKRNPKLVKVKDVYGWTALHWAARLGDKDLVACILKHSANPNAKDKGGMGPLSEAVCREDPAIPALLVAHGAKVSPKDPTTIKSLIYAAGTGALETVELLLDKGADPNGTDERGDSALHVVASGESLAAASLLISRGANVNVRDKYGRTPLHNLVWFGRGGEMSRKMVSLLVSKGADVTIKDRDGRTAASYLSTPSSKKNLLKLLQKKPEQHEGKK